MSLTLLDRLQAPPDRRRSIASYGALADDYDERCRRLVQLRARAVQRLAPQPGEVVFDIGCGTGNTLLQLARHVGPEGRVIGVEPCPAMATRARRRVRESEVAARVQLLQAPAETFVPEAFADAVLMCDTHDVLQSAAAFRRLCTLVRPGGRVVLLALRTLPWAWGWPLNLVNLWRARRYLTTYANLDRPWRLWSTLGARFDTVELGLAGTACIAVGRLPDVQQPTAGLQPAGGRHSRESRENTT